MQFRKVLFFVLIIASVGLACGVNVGLSDLPFMPTGTATRLPTKTPTVTPTYPPKLETTDEQFQVEVQEDNTTIFTDKALGYRLKFNPEWLVLPVGESEQNDLFDAIAEELPQSMLQLLEQTREQAGVRLVALDYTFAFSPDESNIGNLNVIYQQDLAAVEYGLELLLEANVESVPTLVPDSTVTYQALQTNPNGVEYAKMVVSHPASTFGIPLRQMVMMVKLNEGLLVITGSIHEDMYGTVEPVFQTIFDSFEQTN